MYEPRFAFFDLAFLPRPLSVDVISGLTLVPFAGHGFLDSPHGYCFGVLSFDLGLADFDYGYCLC